MKRTAVAGLIVHQIVVPAQFLKKNLSHRLSSYERRAESFSCLYIWLGLGLHGSLTGQNKTESQTWFIFTVDVVQ